MGGVCPCSAARDGPQPTAEAWSFRLNWASHAFQTGQDALDFHTWEFFSPINLNVFIGYSIILWGAEEVRFYDGIKKQKLEVCFNVLALTFSKVILNCAFACACV